jgi:ATP-dependent Clp protease ATP-binding subunit ClpA
MAMMSATMPMRLGVTMRTHNAFKLAHELAASRGHAEVTPVHVFLAILREGQSPAMVVLYNRGVHLKELERELGHEYQGCEHILLAMLRDSDSLPATILARYEVRFADAQAEVLRILGSPRDPRR